MKKTLPLILVITMLFSCFGTFGVCAASEPKAYSNPKAATFTAENGTAVFEAEDATLDKGIVSIKKEKEQSGGKVVEMSTDNRNTPDINSKGGIEFNFVPDAGGSYTIYMRLASWNGGTDSSWYSFDGGEYMNMTLAGNGMGEDTYYKWSKYGSPVTLEAQKSYNIRISTRETGAKIDQFCITKDQSKVPDTNTQTPAPVLTPTPDPVALNLDAPTVKINDFGYFEAESLMYKKGAANVVKDEKAFGGESVEMTVGAPDVPAQDAKGGIEFNFTVSKNASYIVYMRESCASLGADSVWLSKNGMPYEIQGLLVKSETDSSYRWMKMFTLASLKTDTTYSMRILPREAGGRIDSILFTSDGSYIPDDDGEIPDPGKLSIAPIPSDVYPVPAVTPPAEHPRLLFRQKDIAGIKARFENEENKEAYETFQAMLKMSFDGKLPSKPGTNNCNAQGLSIIEAKAFDYAINGHVDNGKSAIDAIQNYTKTVDTTGLGDGCRYTGHAMFVLSEVYDWCYDLLSDEDKFNLTALGSKMGKKMEMGYPPKSQSCITSHGGEAQLLRDMLSFGIATYDEHPEIYNYCAGRILDEYVEARNYYFKSGTHHQGDGYGQYRYQFAQWSAVIFKQMCDYDLYDPTTFNSVPYSWIYLRRPDGQFIREGDSLNDGGTRPGENSTYLAGTNQTVDFLSSVLSGDGYIRYEYLRQANSYDTFSDSAAGISATEYLILNNPDCDVKPTQDLPLTKYFGSPNGTMVARTGWEDGFNSPSIMAYMKIGERAANNHGHLDAGSFQLYYKGILASDSGVYGDYGADSRVNYTQRTVAHNALTIYDPNESFGSRVNDGGQRFPNNLAEPLTMESWNNDGYDVGEVLAHEFGPDTTTPEYSFIAGDITKAYSEKVSEVRRNMLFIPLDENDTEKAAFIVMDKVVSADALFKKAFLLHSQQEPEVDGNTTVIRRDEFGYNGKLTNQTLLPANAAITKLGGTKAECMVNGENHGTPTRPGKKSSCEYGWGRVEISPVSAQKEDYFLNVMFVGDASDETQTAKAALIETDEVVGAAFKNHVALFARNKERLEKSFGFEVLGDGEQTVNISGVKAGSWDVSVNGEKVCTAVATQEGSMLYFKAPCGKYELCYAGADAKKEFTSSSLNNERINIKIDNQYLYSDVLPTIINDRTLVPMRVIFEKLGAKVEWDEASATATATKDDVEIKITENSNIVYKNGNAEEIDVPATILNDRFVVPVRFVSESFGCDVQWHEKSQSVIITTRAAAAASQNQSDEKGVVKEGCALIIGCEWSSHYAAESGEMSYDGDTETEWSVGTLGETVTYKLEEETEIKNAYIYFNKAEERKASFTLEYSSDGKTFTKIGDFTANGLTFGEEFAFAPVKAKYIRYVGNGNNTSTWTAIREIEFRKN